MLPTENQSDSREPSRINNLKYALYYCQTVRETSLQRSHHGLILCTNKSNGVGSM